MSNQWLVDVQCSSRLPKGMVLHCVIGSKYVYIYAYGMAGKWLYRAKINETRDPEKVIDEIIAKYYSGLNSHKLLEAQNGKG